MPEISTLSEADAPVAGRRLHAIDRVLSLGINRMSTAPVSSNGIAHPAPGSRQLTGFSRSGSPARLSLARARSRCTTSAGVARRPSLGFAAARWNDLVPSGTMCAHRVGRVSGGRPERMLNFARVFSFLHCGTPVRLPGGVTDAISASHLGVAFYAYP